jgi:protein TonB
MFEDSTFESNGRIRTRSRGWMLAAFALNSSILLALILAPLLHIQALQYRDPISLIELPPPAAPPAPAHALERAAPSSPTAQADPFTVPRVIPNTISTRPDPAPTGGPINIATDSRSGIPDGFGDVHQPPAPRVVPLTPKAPVRLSTQIASGLLIRKVVPQYPQLARTMRVSGTVELAATIAKDGTIANLRVVSGPAMLQQAALEAVSQWRYRPYLLNGEPVDVETSVNVIFSLGN